MIWDIFLNDLGGFGAFGCWQETGGRHAEHLSAVSPPPANIDLHLLLLHLFLFLLALFVPFLLLFSCFVLSLGLFQLLPSSTVKRRHWLAIGCQIEVDTAPQRWQNGAIISPFEFRYWLCIPPFLYWCFNSDPYLIGRLICIWRSYSALLMTADDFNW